MSAAWRTRILSLAGRIILENGGETYRAEDTVTRMAQAMGMTVGWPGARPPSLLHPFLCVCPGSRGFRPACRSHPC